MKAPRKQKGGELLLRQDVLETASVSEILQDFQVYNQHLREETYLVFEQLHASGELLMSPSVSQYEEAFEDYTFSEAKEVFNAIMNKKQKSIDALVNDRDTEEDEYEFVINTVFTSPNANASANTSANASMNENVLTGGGRLNIDIPLSSITPETVGAYSTKILLSIIERHQTNHQNLSLQDQQSLILCVTEYQIKAMTSLNKLYLEDISISCMLSGAFAKMEEVLMNADIKGGNLSQWVSDAMSIAKQSAAVGQQAVRNLATGIGQGAKTVVKTAHEHTVKMSPAQKMNILQNLFTDVLKWGGKQIMLRVRAPEFDVSSVSDMASFKKEILSFVGNRINQIMAKSEKFKDIKGYSEERLKWIVSILDNIESLLTFIKTISQLSLLSDSPDFSGTLNVKASMSTGVSVNIEPSQWLKDIGESLESLKSIVDTHSASLQNKLNFTLQNVVNENRQMKKKTEQERQIKLLTANIQHKQAILEKQPNNNIIRVELGRVETLKKTLEESMKKEKEEIEETCIQLLQEIHTYVSTMNIPQVPLDIISQKVIRQIALQVDHSAFSSVAGNVVSQVSKIDIGMKTYFGCVSKYLEFCPNIMNVCKHIGFAMPDLHNVIDKLGTVCGFVTNTMSNMGAYMQAANMCLLLIHLIVAASLNCRNSTINKDRVTLEDIKRASQERQGRMTLSKSMGGASRQPKRKGGSIPALPSIAPSRTFSQAPAAQVYQQVLPQMPSRAPLRAPLRFEGQNLRVREGLVDKTREMRFVVRGQKAVLNERVKTHSMYLLEPQMTQEEILKNLLTKSMNSSMQFRQNVHDNVSSYMYANEQSLDNNLSVLDNLRKQYPKLSSVRNIQSLCTASPSVMTDEEDLYVLSIFAKYQGQQLRESFAFSDSSQKPSMESLYCSVSQRMYLEDERLKKIVASIVGNFNGGLLSGGRTIGKSRTSKKGVIDFLEKKTGKELYAYASSKGIPVSSTMRKSKLIQIILDMV